MFAVKIKKRPTSNLLDEYYTYRVRIYFIFELGSERISSLSYAIAEA